MVISLFRFFANYTDLKIIVELVPPNPNELLSDTSIFISLDSFEMKSRSQPSSGLFKLIVGGAMLLIIDIIENIDSIAPAAHRFCRACRRRSVKNRF